MGRMSDAWDAFRGRVNSLDTSAFIKILENFGLRSKAGINITVDRALCVTTVLACTRALAEGISQIPIRVLKDDEEAKKKTVAKDHPVHKVLTRRPNKWMTSFNFRETMMYHAVLTGNAFALKSTARGNLRELNPILPGNVKVKKVGHDLTYEVFDESGPIGTFAQADMFHLRGPSWNTYSGMDIVRYAREAIGLAIATEENHSYLHANGSKVDGILTTPNKLDDASLKRIQALWSAAREVKFGTAVLDNGLDYKKMGMTGVDAQHVQTRDHQIQEICRALGVFPIIIGFSDKTATFASAEAFFTAHVMHSLGPWIERWQSTCNLQLLSDSDLDSGHYVKLFSAGLVKGDIRTRYAAHQIGILTGFETRNEARILEDWDPIEGLDEPLVPLNMGIAGQEPPPTDGSAGPGGGQNTPGNRQIVPGMVVPKSVADAYYARLIGHNGGPPLEDAIETGRLNVGRVISAKNEKKIREASALMGDATGKLSDVLSALDKEPEPETTE
jgi:HK97 family phage portal protein